MNWSTWLVFTGMTLLLAFTPGPAVLLAISTSLSMGPRRAMLGSLGNVAGVFVVSAVSMAGLGVVVATSALAFTVVKLLGAGYLIYLGVRQWRSSVTLFQTSPAAADGDAKTGGGRLFGRGLSIALTNPKSILFFSSLFPQFLRPDTSLAVQFMVLTATFAACALLSHAFYVLLASRFRHLFSNVRHARAFNRVSGAGFIVLGAGLLRVGNRAA